MRIEIPELKSPATAAEKRACVEGMGHVIFHFQREAAYMFLNGGRDSEVAAERIRDMCTELMCSAAKLVGEAQKLEAEQERIEEIREEVLKSPSMAKRAERDRLGSDCTEDDGRCNCNATDISFAHSLALEEDRVRMVNGSYHGPWPYRRR